MKQVLVLQAWALVLVFGGNECTLLGNEEADKPSPSLIKCYRHNSLACCVSAHDQEIQGKYELFLSGQCQREYDNMEDYFCYGCNPEQGEYIDYDNKILYLCKDYAERIWDEDLEDPTDQYDNCGMYTYWRENPSTVIPSKEWANGYDFFQEVKPPYFEEYTIQIVEDDENCFNSAGWLYVSAAILMIFA